MVLLLVDRPGGLSYLTHPDRTRPRHLLIGLNDPQVIIRFGVSLESGIAPGELGSGLVWLRRIHEGAILDDVEAGDRRRTFDAHGKLRRCGDRHLLSHEV